MTAHGLAAATAAPAASHSTDTLGRMLLDALDRNAGCAMRFRAGEA